MGNSIVELQEQCEWKDKINIYGHDHIFEGLLSCTDKTGRQLIGHFVEMLDSDGRQNLITKLQQRKIGKNNIYPIDSYYFEKSVSLCSQQDKCLLLSAKPMLTLQQLLIQRKIQKKRFIKQQINLMINRIGLALEEMKELQQNINFLNMKQIIISKNNFYLLDPLMLANQRTSQTHATFPSPEFIKYNNNLTNDNYNELTSNLFSLGVIALQLYYLQINIYDIYLKDRRTSSIVGINHQYLKSLVENVEDFGLKNKIGILIDLVPFGRINIFKTIKNQCYQRKQAQQTFIRKQIRQQKKCQQNTINFQPVHITTHHSHHGHHDQKHILQQRQNRSNLNSNQNNIKLEFIPPASLQNKKQYIRKDNFKKQFREQNRQLSVNQSQKQNIASLNNSKKQSNKIVSVSSNQKQPLLKPKKQKEQIVETPVKNIKKQMFSTIKEVTEYDDNMSQSQSQQFDSLCNRGFYQGQMKSGQKNGWGKFKFEEGSFYEGEWKKDQMHGFGKLYYPSGQLAYEGHWNCNQFDGYGKVFNDFPKKINQTFNFADFNLLGDQWLIYEGQLVKDRKEGHGCLILSNGERFEGQFFNDKIQGNGVYFTIFGQIIKGVWKDSHLVNRH